MTKLSNFFYNKTSLLTATILTVLTFSYLFLVMTDIAKGFEIAEATPQSLAMSFGFSPEMVQEYFSIRSADMISTYVDFNQIWDNIFALLYGLMYVLWVSFLFKPYSAKAKWLNLFPIVQTVFDWLENFQLANIANDYLSKSIISATDVQLASGFAMVKWTASTLVFIMILIGAVLRIRATVNNRK